MTPAAWDKLLKSAIARAETKNHPRLQALKSVQGTGKTAEVLKKMGIICEADILREFP
jgi:hypothetical protein